MGESQFGLHMDFLVDSGAEESVLPASYADRSLPPSSSLVAANGSPIKAWGRRMVNLCFNGRRYSQEFHIADLLLGADFLYAHNLAPDIRSCQLVDLERFDVLDASPVRAQSSGIHEAWITQLQGSPSSKHWGTLSSKHQGGSPSSKHRGDWPAPSITDRYKDPQALCKTKKSIRDGNFFEGSHLPLYQIIKFTYGWCQNWPLMQANEESGGMSAQTQTDWGNFLGDVRGDYVMGDPRRVGGVHTVNQDYCTPVIVEIDEKFFFHRKYHRGRYSPGQWVFGGVERKKNGRCFLVPVADRLRDTLEPLIRQFIWPGSHIISDGWASYAHLALIDGGSYTHEVVIHEEACVDPDDPSVHTNSASKEGRKLVKAEFVVAIGTKEQSNETGVLGPGGQIDQGARLGLLLEAGGHKAELVELGLQDGVLLGDSVIVAIGFVATFISP
eukprot:snap_masked-scaffold464_size163657-processed-gene-0.13 protein:Tk05276 transcript:snap_masked-scaffold464_size163657-processed-gene-0.13-mRNA-1 annotation:"PREDICTED: uncharacterized protein LOC103309975"